MLQGSAMQWLTYRLGRGSARTQTTSAERACLARHAAGRHSLVEIGVMHGVTTAVLRGVMAPSGTLTGIDPHPRGRLGVSFERWIALREIGRCSRGRVRLIRKYSYEAATTWTDPIDFLFIDGDHSWNGIDRDWTDWNRFLIPLGIIALHDSRSVSTQPDLDSVRYTREVILPDARFRQLDAVDSLTILERVGPCP